MDCELKKVVRYDPATGSLFWKIDMGRRAKAGTEAGHTNQEGYRRVKIYGKMFLVHRLAWYLTYGEWPEGEIDHIDGNRMNNILTNLRDVPKKLNQRNAKKAVDNTSGVTGVSAVYHPTKNWVAQWSDDGGRKTKWFSAKKYGDEEAKRLAIQHRAAQIAKAGGYTERHGL